MIPKPLQRPPKAPQPLHSRPHVIAPKLRAECYETDVYTCRWCGGYGGRLDLHHRQARSQGGQDTLANLVSVHRLCHNFIHSHPDEARKRGFIVSPEAA
jgi:5-methylcytosine-specific restriction endonuclease McrA